MTENDNRRKRAPFPSMELPQEYLEWLHRTTAQSLSDYEAELERREKLDQVSLPLAAQIIHAGYRELAKRCHPDAGGKAADFNALDAAQEQLKSMLGFNGKMADEPTRPMSSKRHIRRKACGSKVRHATHALAMKHIRVNAAEGEKPLRALANAGLLDPERIPSMIEQEGKAKGNLTAEGKATAERLVFRGPRWWSALRDISPSPL